MATTIRRHGQTSTSLHQGDGMQKMASPRMPRLRNFFKSATIIQDAGFELVRLLEGDVEWTGLDSINQVIGSLVQDFALEPSEQKGQTFATRRSMPASGSEIPVAEMLKGAIVSQHPETKMVQLTVCHGSLMLEGSEEINQFFRQTSRRIRTEEQEIILGRLPRNTTAPIPSSGMRKPDLAPHNRLSSPNDLSGNGEHDMLDMEPNVHSQGLSLTRNATHNTRRHAQSRRHQSIQNDGQDTPLKNMLMESNNMDFSITMLDSRPDASYESDNFSALTTPIDGEAVQGGFPLLSMDTGTYQEQVLLLEKELSQVGSHIGVARKGREALQAMRLSRDGPQSPSPAQFAGSSSPFFSSSVQDKVPSRTQANKTVQDAATFDSRRVRITPADPIDDPVRDTAPAVEEFGKGNTRSKLPASSALLDGDQQSVERSLEDTQRPRQLQVRLTLNEDREQLVQRPASIGYGRQLGDDTMFQRHKAHNDLATKMTDWGVASFVQPALQDGACPSPNPKARQARKTGGSSMHSKHDRNLTAQLRKPSDGDMTAVLAQQRAAMDLTENTRDHYFEQLWISNNAIRSGRLELVKAKEELEVVRLELNAARKLIDDDEITEELGEPKPKVQDHIDNAVINHYIQQLENSNNAIRGLRKNLANAKKDLENVKSDCDKAIDGTGSETAKAVTVPKDAEARHSVEAARDHYFHQLEISNDAIRTLRETAQRQVILLRNAITDRDEAVKERDTAQSQLRRDQMSGEHSTRSREPLQDWEEGLLKAAGERIVKLESLLCVTTSAEGPAPDSSVQQLEGEGGNNGQQKNQQEGTNIVLQQARVVVESQKSATQQTPDTTYVPNNEELRLATAVLSPPMNLTVKEGPKRPRSANKNPYYGPTRKRKPSFHDASKQKRPRKGN